MIAEASGSYQGTLSGNARPVPFSENFVIDASDNSSGTARIDSIIVSWNGEPDSNAVYYLQYALKGTSDWHDIGTVDFATKKREITSLDISHDYTFRLALEDKDHKEDGRVYSEAVDGEFAKVMNISASKGDNGRVHVSWNPVNGATGYEVYCIQ